MQDWKTFETGLYVAMKSIQIIINNFKMNFEKKSKIQLEIRKLTKNVN